SGRCEADPRERRGLLPRPPWGDPAVCGRLRREGSGGSWRRRPPRRGCPPGGGGAGGGGAPGATGAPAWPRPTRRAARPARGAAPAAAVARGVAAPDPVCEDSGVTFDGVAENPVGVGLSARVAVPLKRTRGGVTSTRNDSSSSRIVAASGNLWLGSRSSDRIT